mgnify:CR=1 FL=1
MTRFPQVLELRLLAHRIHALPEALMLVAHELPFRSQTAQRLLLENAVIPRQIVKDLRLEDHITSIDWRAVHLRLLAEGMDGIVAADVQDALRLILQDCRERRQLAMRLMELDELADIDITDTVAIRHAERLIADIRLDTLDAPAGHRAVARIDDRHAPRLRMLLVQDDLLAIRHIKRHVTHVEEVVVEPLLNHVLLVSGTDDKVIDTKRRIHLHDVPENRLAANLDHRLWLVLRFLRNTRAVSTG